MSRLKGFRDFIAEQFVSKSNGLIDLDKGYTMADELWDKASKGKDKKAQTELGKLAKMYN